MADNIFNMGSTFAINSESRGEQLTFGAYNGHLTVAMFRSNSGKRPAQLNVSNEFYMGIKRTLSDLLKSGPGAVFPIRTLKWDQQTKKRELSIVLTFGRDNSDIFYIEFKDVDSAPVKFPFIGNKNLEFMDNSDSARSKLAFEGFVHFVNTVWPHTQLYTRNNLVKINSGSSSRSQSSSPAPTAAPMPGNDDDEVY